MSGESPPVDPAKLILEENRARLLYAWDYTKRTGDLIDESKCPFTLMLRENLQDKQIRHRIARIFHHVVLHRLSIVRSLTKQWEAEKAKLDVKKQETSSSDVKKQETSSSDVKKQETSAGEGKTRNTNEKNRLKVLEKYKDQETTRAIALIRDDLIKRRLKPDEDKEATTEDKEAIPRLFRATLSLEFYKYCLELSTGDSKDSKRESEAGKMRQEVKEIRGKMSTIVKDSKTKLDTCATNLKVAQKNLKTEQEKVDEAQKKVDEAQKKVDEANKSYDNAVQQREEAVMFRLAEIMYVHDSKGKHKKAIEMAEKLYSECCCGADRDVPMIRENMSLLRDTILIWMVMD